MEHLRKPLTVMTLKLFLAARDLKRNPETGENANIIISPFAVTSYATMLYYAAKTGSLASRQLENVLHYAELFECRADHKTVLMAFRDAIMTLTKNQPKCELEPSSWDIAPEFSLIMANRIFVQRGAELDEDFVATIGRNLKIEVETLDFSHNVEEVKHNIEAWLKEKVKSRWNNGVPPDLIDEEYKGPRAVIANAAYYRGGWVVPFDPKLTMFRTFTLEDGKTTKQVEMMRLTEKFPYTVDDTLGVEMLEIPYYKNGASLVITLPSKKLGIDGLLAATNADWFVKMHMTRRMRTVRLTLPKFRIHCCYSVKSLLNAIGVKEIYHNRGEDMSYMTKEKEFRVSEGIHKAAIRK